MDKEFFQDFQGQFKIVQMHLAHNMFIAPLSVMCFERLLDAVHAEYLANIRMCIDHRMYSIEMIIYLPSKRFLTSIFPVFLVLGKEMAQKKLSAFVSLEVSLSFLIKGQLIAHQISGKIVKL